MGLKIVNGAWGTLAAGILAADTAVNLTAGHGTRFGSFAAGDYMYCTVIKASSNQTEYIKLTARSTDALTAVRGLDGSTAIDFDAGDRIECRPLNAAVRAAAQEMGAIEAAGTDTYTGTLDPVPTAYNTRQLYLVGFANTNTSTTPTLNLNGIGAKTIKRQAGGALTPSMLPRWALLQYNGTDLILLNESTAGGQLAFIATSSTIPTAAPAAAGFMAVGIGNGAVASGSRSFVGGGDTNTASGSWSATIGGRLLTSKRPGQVTFGAMSDSDVGYGSVVVAERETTNATPTELLCQNATRIAIAASTIVTFRIMVSARRLDVAGECAAYEFSGAIKNTGGTTALLGTPNKTVLGEDDSAWDCAVTADDANDALVVTATGAGGKTIQWVARVDMCEAGPGVA